MPPKHSCFDPAGGINREQVPGGEINGQGKQDARQSGQRHLERRRPIEQTRAQPHYDDLQGKNGRVRQIFPHHDLTKASRRGEQELDTAAIGAKIVVSEIGQQEQRIRGAERKGQPGRVREQAFVFS